MYVGRWRYPRPKLVACAWSKFKLHVWVIFEARSLDHRTISANGPAGLTHPSCLQNSFDHQNSKDLERRMIGITGTCIC